MSSPDMAVPPLDDELEDVLDALAGIYAGIDLIRDGVRLLLTDRLDLDQTQTLSATIAGSVGADVLTLIGLAVQRLTNPTSNPCLRQLPEDQRKQTQKYGERVARDLLDPNLHTAASEASAAITGT
jgi:hypothetical protein